MPPKGPRGIATTGSWRRLRSDRRWGLLSTARINRKILAGAPSPTASRSLAVAAREQARAEAYAREHGIERAYGGYDALLSDPDVEAVYISLPNSLHVEWTIRALAAASTSSARSR